MQDKQPMQYLLKLSQSECPDIWIRLPRHKWPKSWANIEDPEVPLERHLFGHPFSGLLSERQFEEVLLELGWDKKYRTGNVFSFTENKDCSDRFTWMTLKLMEESRIWIQCGRN